MRRCPGGGGMILPDSLRNGVRGAGGGFGGSGAPPADGGTPGVRVGPPGAPGPPARAAGARGPDSLGAGARGGVGTPPVERMTPGRATRRGAVGVSVGGVSVRAGATVLGAGP